MELLYKYIINKYIQDKNTTIISAINYYSIVVFIVTSAFIPLIYMEKYIFKNLYRIIGIIF